MLNNSTSRSEYVVQSGVTQYPIGFAFRHNGDGTPQLRVTIGDMVAEENEHFVISEDLLTITLVSLGENDGWVGSALVIERDIPFVQESDYQLGRISSEQIEKDFDLSVMRDQMLAGKTDTLDEKIQKTRDDMNTKDSQLETTLNSHTSELTTLRGNQVELGNRVSGVESKIPESASASNQLATKEDLANIDLDDYVKKSGDTMTGDLVIDGHGAPSVGPEIKFVGLGPNPSYGQEFMTTISTFRGAGLSIKKYLNGEVQDVLNFSDGFWGYSYINDKMLNSGTALYPWQTTFTKVLNAGNEVVGDTTSGFSGNLIVPTEGGTLARMEDLIDLREGIATKAEKDSVYTKEQVDAKMSSVYKVKGSVSTESALPANPSVGDVYNVLDTGANYVWSSEGFWDKLGDVVDLSGYATKDELGNYLPTTGGELTGRLRLYDGVSFYSQSKYYGSLLNGFDGVYFHLSGGKRFYFEDAFYAGSTSGDPMALGTRNHHWSLAYIEKLNNGADLNIPTEAGTLARVEDVNAIGGDGTTGQVLTKTADGMAWQDASGGDCLPLSGGTMAGDIFMAARSTTSTYNIMFAVPSKPNDSNYFYRLGHDASGTDRGFGIWVRNGGTGIRYFFTLNSFCSQSAYSNDNIDLGNTDKPWKTIYVAAMNNGADLAVPTEGGTLARIEDIDAAVGDISTALTAILGE